jgi:alkylation response protein AidB-like acyl-CoA dehydrogenase
MRRPLGGQKTASVHPMTFETYRHLPLDSRWMEETRAAITDMAGQHADALKSAERSGRFPRDIYLEMGRRGLIGCITPPAYGGTGGGPAEYCFIAEEVGAHFLVSPQISIQGQRWLIEWGTSQQKDRYLAGIAQGTLLFSESISEPGVGSSFKAMRATAERRHGRWVLNGRKTHVNLGAECEVTAFYAIGEAGLTSFLVDMATPGVTAVQTEPIGTRLLPTADVELNDVIVSDDALLGAPGRGMDTFLSVFNLSRLGNASELIGLSRRGLRMALDYARHRQVGESVVTDFQGIQWTVADCYATIIAAALARNVAACEATANAQDLGFQTSLAKKMAIDAGEQVSTQMFALIGGYGLYHDVDFARIMHDIKVLRIGGGSLEVLRNYVFRKILKSSSYRGLM